MWGWLLKLGLPVLIGFALGGAWEHRGPTPGAISWLTGQSLAYQRDQLQSAINAPDTGWSARVSSCRGSLARLEHGAAVQEAGVQAMIEGGRAQTAVARQMASTAEKTASANRAVAAEILARYPASENVCASAFQLVRDYAGER